MLFITKKLGKEQFLGNYLFLCNSGFPSGLWKVYGRVIMGIMARFLLTSGVCFAVMSSFVKEQTFIPRGTLFDVNMRGTWMIDLKCRSRGVGQSGYRHSEMVQ